MPDFKRRPGTKSAYRTLKKPIADIGQFNAMVQSFIHTNPLGCTAYHTKRKHYPPVQKVREMYTAKFVYLNPGGKRVGTGLDRYDSVEGYRTGVAAIISNIANIMSHRGTVRHMPDGELYYLSIARDRITISSYRDDAIRHRIETWADGIPALA
jgi:hypothetical protein